MNDLNFMASQGFQVFNTMELLGMEKIHDKLIRIGVAHLSLERGLYLISMTHIDVLSLLFKLLNLISYLKTLTSHLYYFLLSIVLFICFPTYFFDNITLCIDLPHVTLSNMSHLVYITLFGELDGVTF